MKPAILVAGGAGYIGAHVCKALHAAGYLPVVLDDLSAGHADFVRWGPLVRACVSDTPAVSAAIAEHGILACIDLAGSIEVAESIAQPLKYYENNLARKIPFLRSLQLGGVKAIVFSSTAAVYGEPEQIPIPESHPKAPKSPYGASKLMLEQLLQDHYAAGGMAYMALRYFNAAGASPDGEIGEAHEPESHLIPRACLAALGRIPPLDIFGQDYPTPDGTAIRDYIHVMDLAEAHVKAVTALLAGAKPHCYNLGTGTGTSILQILDGFKQLGIHVPHQFKPRRAGDPARLVANADAAQTQLGWTPHYTHITDIIRTAYQWHAKP